MRQLSGLDASFMYAETPSSPMHVASVSIYDQSTAPGGTVTFKGILDNIDRRLQMSPVFRQKAVRVPMDLDHPYWVEDQNFDLEYHVRHIALPKPGDWRQLCIQVARLHSRVLDTSRPLWEVYVIEGLDHVEGVPPGSFAVMQKTHHAAVDGVSGMEILSALHDQTPDAEPPPRDDGWKGEPDPEAWTLLSRAAFNNFMRPMQYVELVGRTTATLWRAQDRLTRFGRQASTVAIPRTRFNASISAHRVVDGYRLELSRMRAVKAFVPGATINDGVLATVSGALRRYLFAKGELPAGSLVAMAPISVRTESQMGSAGNQVTAMRVNLATDIADPVERLTAVHQSTHEQKEFTNAIGASELVEYSQFVPGGLMALATRTANEFDMANRANPLINTVVTNVPGPQVPLYFTGARLVTLLGIGPIVDGMGLIHPVTSYCGELVIGFTACREMVPDPAFYRQCIEESFAELVERTSS